MEWMETFGGVVRMGLRMQCQLRWGEIGDAGIACSIRRGPEQQRSSPRASQRFAAFSFARGGAQGHRDASEMVE